MATGNGGNGSGYAMPADSGSGSGLGGQGYAGPPPQGPARHMPEHQPEGLTLRDYIAVVWRRKWVILLVLAVATVSAFFFSYRQTKQFSTSASIIYERQIDLANPLTGQSYMDTQAVDREMAGISDVMASPDMQRRATDYLKAENVDTSADFTVTATPQSDTSSSSSNSASNVVMVTADSTDAALTARAANAYAETFVEWSKERQKTQIGKAIDVIEAQLNQYQGAAQESADYVLLNQRLQDLQILEATATGNYRVLVPASVPEAPYAPQPLRSAILGFAVGLFAGIGLAFLLEQFDNRVRRPDEVATILRQPVLGRVPRISSKILGESALVTLRHPDGQVAEAFRMVRTNLEFMAVDNEIRSLLITSSMKGEGKSVAVANLAVTMAMAGKKVVVVDGDLRRPRQHSYFGIGNEAGVSTVTAGKTKLFESLVPIEVAPPMSGTTSADFTEWAHGSDALSRLYVLPSGPIPPNPGEIVASRRFDAIIQTLVTEADLVIVDSPAMLAVGDTSALAAKVDGLVFLVDMQLAKRPQLITAADQLLRLPTKMLGTVVRTYGPSSSRYYYSPYYYRYSYAEDGQQTKLRRRKTDRVPAADGAQA